MENKEEKMSAYGIFHCQNIGYKFMEHSTGKVYTKLQLFCRYIDNQLALDLLTDNNHQEYVKVNSQGWMKNKLLQCSGDGCPLKRSCSRWSEKHSFISEFLKGVYYTKLDGCKYHIEKTANSSLRNDY